MIYGYIRVSTDKQTVENQRYEILKFCETKNFIVDGWIEETISGTKDPKNANLVSFYLRFKKATLSSVLN